MTLSRWRVPKGSGTHVLMDGGVLYVPTEEAQEFYSEYIRLVNSGTKLYVVEQKTERFKFFVDLDYKSHEKLKDDDLIQFCSIIHEALETRSRCLIARAQPRPVKDGLIKSGVHIHWPDLIVTRTQAMNFRTNIIARLSEAIPFEWDKVIDASVYGGSGLRMLWSHKKPSGDPYVPWRQLGAPVEFSKAPDLETLQLFCVRTEDDVSTPETLENTGALEEFVRRYMAGQERTRIKKVQRHEHDGWYAQSDSRYCERIHKEHKSNHVWFHISRGKISQRCFDEECSEFKGTELILPPSIVEQLQDVVVVGSPSACFLVDIFPDGSPFQKVQDARPSVLGSRSRELVQVPDEPRYIRTVGFDSNR